MAVDLRCPHCRDNLGKDTEEFVDAWCGTCGTNFYNPRGYVDSEEHYQECKKKYPGRIIPKPETEE